MATRINNIADYLRSVRPQTAPLDSAMMTRSLSKTPPPIVKAQDALNPSLGYNIPDAGYYGGGATLPSNPSPPDPFVEPTPIPGANAPAPSPAPPSGTLDYGNIFTRLDPNMGYLPPSVEITGSGGGPSTTTDASPSMPWDGAYWPPTTTTTEGMSPTTSNVISKIIGGGASAFGGPLAGIAAGYGSRALLNKLFGPKSVYDANPQPPGQEAAGGQTGGAGNNAGLLNPGQYAQQTFGGLTPTGYRDPSGSAASDSHAANELQMWYQSIGGNPNDMRTSDEGATRFYNGVMQLDPGGGITQVGDRVFGARLPSHPLINSPESIAAYNAYMTGLQPKGPSLAGDVTTGLDPKLFPVGRGG